MPQPIVMELTKARTKRSSGRSTPTRRGPTDKPAVAPTPPPPARTTETGVLRVIPFGGIEEVGRNLTALEYTPPARQAQSSVMAGGKTGKPEILIIDMGVGFPSAEEMPGVDCVIQNVEYLAERRDQIVGALVTHGHYDHIGAIPYLLEALGNPTIYTTPLTRGLIIKRQDDFPQAPKPEIVVIEKNQPKQFRLGSFVIDYFHVNHTIPDSVGFFIRTPAGNVMHTGDFKIDFTPIFDQPADLARIVRLAQEGTTLLLMDSTNAPKPGHVISERKIMENLEEVVKQARGRVIAATFASLIERVQHLIYIAAQHNRKIVIEGHSMRLNVEVCKRLGYLQYTKNIFISPEEANKLPPQQVIVVCTGAQAEDRAVLARIANREHRHFQVIPGDTIIFSSSIVPGNERAVQSLRDALAKQGAKIVHSDLMDLHASGHGFSDDIRLLINLVKPDHLMPVHGQFYMMQAVKDIGLSFGIPEEKILMTQNGSVVEVTPGRAIVSHRKVPANIVMVDGIGVGDIGDIVLRDRQVLSKDGMFVIIAIIDSQNGKLRVSPDIISRGFVYLREAKDLLHETRDLVRRIVEKNIRFLGDEAPIIQEEHIRNHLREDVAEFLFKKTKRRPVVLPVVIKV